MSSALQNRLVGTIIIVALAVIFLPDILDGKKQSSQDLFTALPEQPKMRPVVEAKPFPKEQVKQAVERKEEVVPDVAVDDFDQAELAVQQRTDQNGDSLATRAETLSEQAAPSDTDRKIADVSGPQANGTGNQVDDSRLLAEAGWVVQLGVFRHQKNVRELLTKLRSAGFRAFSRPVKTSTGELTKVFVGPELQKQKLEDSLPRLLELTKLKGRITPFTVK